MNRADKTSKLCSAVKDWRGLIDPKTKKWIRPPKPKAQARVARWLSELGLDGERELKLIAGFARYSDFYAWIKTTYEPMKETAP